MKSLKSINTSVFENCTITEFDAPNIYSITVDKDEDNEITFTVGKKNF